jgi:LytS/YehU family sensor histidine kinase
VRGGESQAAVTTIAGLSDLLRYALDSSGAPLVTLEEEMGAMRRYLAIQELRYGGRLSVTLDVDPETLHAAVPRLLLQPLVENAVRHGVATNGNAPWLRLRTRRAADQLRIEIENSASSEPPSESRRGIGLPKHARGSPSSTATRAAGRGGCRIASSSSSRFRGRLRP